MEDKIPDYKMYYYEMLFEQIMFGWLENGVIINNKIYELEEFYQALKLFIEKLKINCVYPVNVMNNLTKLLEEIKNNTEGDMNIKYSVLLFELENNDFKNSYNYLEDMKSVHHSSLNDRFQCIYYPKEYLENEMVNDYLLFSLLLAGQFNQQDTDFYKQPIVLEFLRALLGESADILDNQFYRKDIEEALRKIAMYSENKKKATDLLYQIKTGVLETLQLPFDYQKTLYYSKAEKIRNDILNPCKIYMDNYSDTELYSADFKEIIEHFLNTLSDVPDVSDLDDSGFRNNFVYKKILNYLANYDELVRREVPIDKNKIEWINEQKSKLNLVGFEKLNSYLSGEIILGTLSYLEFASVSKNLDAILELLSNILLTDSQFLEIVMSSPYEYECKKDELASNEYLLFSIAKYLKTLKEMFTDYTIFTRTKELLDKNILSSNKLANKFKAKMLKKQLKQFYGD